MSVDVFDIAAATNAPTELTIGGRSFRARALKMAEWGSLQRWLTNTVPSPMVRALNAIAESEASGKPVSDATQRILLALAAADDVSFPPRIGTPAWLLLLDSVDGGLQKFLFTALAGSNPELTEAECDGLADEASTAELVSLQSVAILGKIPPKAEAGPDPL